MDITTMTDNSLTPKKFRLRLSEIIEREPNTLRAAVAEEALDYHEPSRFFEDLQNCGCMCGSVGSLIYYVDTQAFFDLHYREIENLREEYEENNGVPITIKGDLKNFFAWFAFEETAFTMARERPWARSMIPLPE